jgi:hypothetical protein
MEKRIGDWEYGDKARRHKGTKKKGIREQGLGVPVSLRAQAHAPSVAISKVVLDSRQGVATVHMDTVQQGPKAIRLRRTGI